MKTKNILRPSIPFKSALNWLTAHCGMIAKEIKQEFSKEEIVKLFKKFNK